MNVDRRGSPDPPSRSSRHRGGPLVDTAWVLVAHTYILLVGSVLMILLARLLTPADFGAFQLVLSTAGLLQVVTDLGMSHSTPRYIAEYRRKQPDRVRATAISGIVLAFSISLVACGLLFLLRDRIALAVGLGGRESAMGLGIGVLLLFTLHNFMLKLFEGFQRFKNIPAVVFCKNTLDIVVTLSLVFAGYGLFGALLGKVMASLAAIVLSLILFRSRILPGLPRSAQGLTVAIRDQLRYGSSLFLVDAATRVLAYADRVLIGRMLSVSLVGVYAVPARIIEIAQVVGQSAASAVAPSMAGGAGAEPGAKRQFLDALRLLFAFYLFTAGLISILAEPIILGLFGNAYAGSVPVLRTVAWALPFMGISPLVSITLNYLGEAMKRVVFVSGAAVILVTGNLVLIPRMGIQGSAAALVIAQCFYALAQLAYGTAHLGLGGGQVVSMLLRVTAAGVLSFGPLFLVAERLNSPGHLVLACLGVIPAYGGLLAVLGMLHRRDASRFRSLARSLGSRGDS